MSKRTKKIILLIIAALVVCAAIMGYMLWNKPHRDVKDADAIAINAAALYDSFVKDSASSKNLYVDKVVEIMGEVVKTSVNQQDQQLIFIRTNTSGAYINCTMEEKLPAVKAGDNIKIKGICSGYISGDIDMGLPGDVFIIRGYPSK